MKKFVSMLCAFLGLFMIGFTVQPSSTAQASEKTYVIDTDVTFPPFVYANEDNKYVGIDMDLIRAIAKEEGFKIKIRPVGFNAAVQSVSSGQADGVIAGMSITDERKAKFDFSDPYYSSGIVMGVKPNGDVKSLKDLKGKKVAVKTGLGLKIATKSTNIGDYGFAVKKGHNKELMKMFNEGLAKLKKNGEYDKIIERYTGEKATHAKKEKAANSHTIIGLLKENGGVIVSGLFETIKLTVISIICATLFGILIGFLGVVPNKIAQGVSGTVIYIFRGLPLIVLALFIYNGIPSLTGSKIPAFVAGVITLMLNEGAYIAAFVKGGIEAVDSGQMEAARSLGLPFGKAMRKVVLPQGIKIMIPSFINQFIITLKDTSILSVIGLLELTQTGKIIIARNLEGFRVWTIVAVIYLVLITVLTLLSKWVERRIKD